MIDWCGWEQVEHRVGHAQSGTEDGYDTHSRLDRYIQYFHLTRVKKTRVMHALDPVNSDTGVVCPETIVHQKRLVGVRDGHSHPTLVVLRDPASPQ